MVVGDQDHDDVAALGGLGGGHDREPGGFGLVPVAAAGQLGDDDIDARVAQVERVGVALAAVTDNGDGAAFQMVQSCVFFIVAFSHGITPL